MRTGPIGLFHQGDLKKLRRDAALVCVITHTHQTAVASAIAQSAAVAYCLTQDATGFSPDRFIEFVVACIEGVEETDVPERRPRAARTTLAKRLAELPGLLGEPDTGAVYE